MAAKDLSLRMTPAHPGDIVRIEVVEELGLNIYMPTWHDAFQMRAREREIAMERYQPTYPDQPHPLKTQTAP